MCVRAYSPAMHTGFSGNKGFTEVICTNVQGEETSPPGTHRERGRRDGDSAIACLQQRSDSARDGTESSGFVES